MGLVGLGFIFLAMLSPIHCAVIANNLVPIAGTIGGEPVWHRDGSGARKVERGLFVRPRDCTWT